MALSVAYQATTALTGGSGPTYTASAMAIGAADATRVVAVALVGNSDTGRTISSVTIGGVTATQAVNGFVSGAIVNASIWYASVPTGTTADVVVTASGNFDYWLVVNTWSVTGSGSTFVSSTTAPNLSGFAGSYSVNVPANGGAIFLTSGAASPAADDTTWTNATKDVYSSPGSFCRMGAASLTTASTLTSYSVSVSGGAGTFGYGAASVSFGPGADVSGYFPASFDSPMAALDPGAAEFHGYIPRDVQNPPPPPYGGFFGEWEFQRLPDYVALDGGEKFSEYSMEPPPAAAQDYGGAFDPWPVAPQLSPAPQDFSSFIKQQAPPDVTSEEWFQAASPAAYPPCESWMFALFPAQAERGGDFAWWTAADAAERQPVAWADFSGQLLEKTPEAAFGEWWAPQEGMHQPAAEPWDPTGRGEGASLGGEFAWWEGSHAVQAPLPPFDYFAAIPEVVAAAPSGGTFEEWRCAPLTAAIQYEGQHDFEAFEKTQPAPAAPPDGGVFTFWDAGAPLLIEAAPPWAAPRPPEEAALVVDGVRRPKKRVERSPRRPALKPAYSIYNHPSPPKPDLPPAERTARAKPETSPEPAPSPAPKEPRRQEPAAKQISRQDPVLIPIEEAQAILGGVKKSAPKKTENKPRIETKPLTKKVSIQVKDEKKSEKNEGKEATKEFPKENEEDVIRLMTEDYNETLKELLELFNEVVEEAKKISSILRGL